MPGFLAPFKGERYQMSDFMGVTGIPRGAKELFNRRHSSLRNVIERTFGVLKKRWQILEGPMLSYKYSTQIRMVINCCILHNFLRDVNVNDDLFIEEELQRQQLDEEDDGMEGNGRQQIDLSHTGIRDWEHFRQSMADHMHACSRRRHTN